MARFQRSPTLKFSMPVLLCFFDALVEEFGHIEEWASLNPPQPGRGLDERFKRFLGDWVEHLAEMGIYTDAAALKRNIKYAAGTDTWQVDDKNHAKLRAMNCQCAAIEVGWMMNRHLDPDLPIVDARVAEALRNLRFPDGNGPHA